MTTQNVPLHVSGIGGHQRSRRVGKALAGLKRTRATAKATAALILEATFLYPGDTLTVTANTKG